MSRRGRVSYGTIMVEAEVDVSDIIDDIDDDDLRSACKARGIAIGPKAPAEASGVPSDFAGLMDEFREAMATHDGRHFEILILRLEALMGMPHPAMPAKAFRTAATA